MDPMEIIEDSDTEIDSEATEEYSHHSGSPSSSSSVVPAVNIGGKWGPIRLYREASMDNLTHCIEWCMQAGLMFSAMECRRHRCARTLRIPQDRTGFWYCGGCNERKSIYTGSIFVDAKLPIPHALLLMLGFAHGCNYEEVIRYCIFDGQGTSVSSATVARWYQAFREAVTDHFIQQNQRGSKIGGVERIVQIDEAMIGRRKYNRGRLVEGTWVVGMIDDTGDVRLEVCVKRDVETLTDIIARNVEIGSIVCTDQWRGYNTERLAWLGLQHQTVNHSVEFVAEDGTHTQRIESQWRALRRHFSSGGIRKEDIADHLIEYAWRRKCGVMNVDPSTELIKICRAC